MLKKHFGGLTLLIFTFTFAVPLLVGVNISDAGPTQVFRQPWKTDFYCPDGTYATSSSGTHVNEYYHGHPADNCQWEETGHEPWCFIWCVQQHEEYVCSHVGHSSTSYYNSTLDYTTVTLSSNSSYCN